MNAESVNRWLTLGANVGILIGIMLLLLELEQNSTMMRGQTRNEVSSELINLMSQVVENRDIAELIDRANSGEELTPVESIQYEHREVAMFRYFENVHYQYRQGLYDESEFSTQREAWRRYASPARIKFWCDYRLTVSLEFRAEMDRLIAANEC